MYTKSVFVLHKKKRQQHAAYQSC